MTDVRLPNRGEIWVVDFNPARGTEQKGRRPALVIQNDIGNQNPRYRSTVVLAMTTKGKPVPFHIRIQPNRRNGLHEVTYVKCEQILTITKDRIEGPQAIGRLSPDEMQRVETAVKLSLALA